MAKEAAAKLWTPARLGRLMQLGFGHSSSISRVSTMLRDPESSSQQSLGRVTQRNERAFVCRSSGTGHRRNAARRCVSTSNQSTALGTLSACRLMRPSPMQPTSVRLRRATLELATLCLDTVDDLRRQAPEESNRRGSDRSRSAFVAAKQNLESENVR